MGADDNILSNKFLPFGKVRMGYPSGEARWGLKVICRVTCSFPLRRTGWVVLWVYPGFCLKSHPVSLSKSYSVLSEII